MAALHLRTRLVIAQQSKDNQKIKETIDFIHKRKATHLKVLTKSPWQSLPELTNRNGTDCPDGCPACTGVVYGMFLGCTV